MNEAQYIHITKLKHYFNRVLLQKVSKRLFDNWLKEKGYDDRIASPNKITLVRKK